MFKTFGFVGTLLALFLLFAQPALMAQDAAVPVAAAAAAAPAADSGGSPSFFKGVLLANGSVLGIMINLMILMCSLAMVALVVDSFITVSEPRIIPVSLVSRVQESMEQGDVIKALNICNEEPGPMANILAAAFENVEGGFEAIQDSVAVQADLQSEKLMQRVNYLSVVGNLAPMLGLMGTVYGMILAFGTLASAGATAAAQLAQSINMALYTTLFGLVIAVPALAFFYFFRNRAATVILRMEEITLDQIKVLRHIEVVDEEE